MRRDRKLCWQQHCPELHLLSVSRWICEVSAQRPPPSTHHKASALSRFIVPIRDAHTFGPWSEYTTLNNHLFLDFGLMAAMEWNHFDKKKKKNLIHMWPQQLIPSLFSSADPRVLQCGDVNTWQCFSIHSAGNASSVIVVLLEVVVVVEGGVTFFFFLTGKCKNN